MAESLCCPPDIITGLLIDYTPIQNKKLKKKRQKKSASCSPHKHLCSLLQSITFYCLPGFYLTEAKDVFLLGVN